MTGVLGSLSLPSEAVVTEHYPSETLKRVTGKEALNSEIPRNSKRNGPTVNYNSASPPLIPNVNTIHAEEIAQCMLLISHLNYALE